MVAPCAERATRLTLPIKSSSLHVQVAKQFNVTAPEGASIDMKISYAMCNLGRRRNNFLLSAFARAARCIYPT